MGNTALLNAFLQSDLDAAGHHIINCPDIGAGSGPNDFPNQANIFLRGYNATTKNFSGKQVAIGEVANFPSQVGQAGKFLTTDGGSVLSWAIPAGATTGGFLNVKQAPYNAVGDGVHDDRAAIMAALADAGGGLTVYFPKGTYLCSAPIVVPLGSSLLGDNPFQCILKLPRGVNGGLLQVGAGSVVTRLGFVGPLAEMVQGDPTTVLGIGMANGNAMAIIQCLVTNFPSHGIAASNCYGLIIRDCYILNCGGYGIELFGSGNSRVFANQISGCVGSGIWLVNSPNGCVANNQIYSCGAFGYGIGMNDSDNTVVGGNLIQQCAVGMVGLISNTRALVLSTNVSYGYVMSGNNVIRNYYGGVLLGLCHGFNLSGNIVTENGQGGTDNATYTIEPGIVIDAGNVGTNYAAGDVLTVVGGTGTPAKAIVIRVGTGGAITADGLVPITMGSYTTLPGSNPLSTTCSRSGPSGAKVIMTTSKIAAAGSGYVVGQILRATGGTFYNPVRVQVTAIGAGGAVTAYGILDGGGYYGGLPTPINFANDAFAAENPVSGPGAGPTLPDVPAVAAGFTLAPLWGLRYSQPGKFGGLNTFGVRTYGITYFGIIANNAIDWVQTGTGILISDAASGIYAGRADYLCVTGNSLVDNKFDLQGMTDGGVLDGNYLLHSTFANNFRYPIPAGGGGGGPVVSLQTTTQNPAATASTSGVMMGLGLAASPAVITPVTTGKVFVTVTGYMFNNTAGGTVSASLMYGTGTAPANGVAPVGTPIGSITNRIGAGWGANMGTPFSLTGMIGGLALGTPVWLDLVVAAVAGGGNAQVANVTVAAFEVPIN